MLFFIADKLLSVAKFTFKKRSVFCSAFSNHCFISNFCYINICFMQDIVNLAYTTNAAYLPYINVDRIGRIAAYAPEPSPKIAKRIMI